MTQRIEVKTTTVRVTSKEAKKLRTGYGVGTGDVTIDRQARQTFGSLSYVGCVLRDDGADEDDLSIVFIAVGKQHEAQARAIYDRFTS